jgi:hypothetical protein
MSALEVGGFVDAAYLVSNPLSHPVQLASLVEHLATVNFSIK